jgi:hypothetical protein
LRCRRQALLALLGPLLTVFNALHNSQFCEAMLLSAVEKAGVGC